VDFFRVPAGIVQAFFIIKKFKADKVFSKGGYVSLPVVIAAKLLSVPVILHESDLSPGLANKIAAKFASKICLSFEESKKYFKKFANKKVLFTGSPIRNEILEGNIKDGYKFTKLDKFRPIILIMGGSQGAAQINKLVIDSLDQLLKKFQIIHLVGRGNLNISIHKRGYTQYEFLNEQLKDVYAISELIISRAGANSLFEIAALKKKAIIIPLSTNSSRGDQIENARIFIKKYGWSVLQGKVNCDDFIKAIEFAQMNQFEIKEPTINATKAIVDLLLKK